MPNVMVVGASRGIGLELARQYAGDSWRVHATTRSPETPESLGIIAGDLVLHRLDVREPEQIAALADALGQESIDVLIHNAGVRGNDISHEEVMRINAQGPIRVTQAMLGAVQRGKHKTIVLMTSQLGARRGGTGSLGPYGDSKAALNDEFRRLAPEWAKLGLTSIVMHPGWVRTDMGGAGAPLSVEQSATGIRRVVAQLTPENHGQFLTWKGHEHPW